MQAAKVRSTTHCLGGASKHGVSFSEAKHLRRLRVGSEMGIDRTNARANARRRRDNKLPGLDLRVLCHPAFPSESDFVSAKNV